MSKRKPKVRAKPSPIVLARAPWPEAEVIAEPLKEKLLKKPTVLVRRRVNEIVGPNDEQIFVVHGAGQHISLFTGVGGMDIGVEQAGFVTVVQHEMDWACCETLLTNRPDYFRHSALIQGDIVKTPTEMILGEAGLRVGEADLLTGGPPCQGFSTAGKRQAGDIRNTLVFEFLRVVRQAQPKFFVMENVPGFLSLAKGRFFRAFLEMAYHDCYYELVYGLVNAVEYGVPQDRCRFLCMGTRRDLWAIEGKLGSLPRPTHFSDSDLKELVFLEKRPLMGREFELLQHPPGIRYFPDRPLLIPPRPTFRRSDDKDITGRSKTFLTFYKRLQKHEPDRIVAEPIMGHAESEIEPANWITVREAIGDLPSLE